MTGVLFIVGAGPRIGFAVALAFKERGFKVAIGSRNPDTEQARDAGLTAVQVDVTDSSLVSRAFEDVRSKLGIPNVVVYNGELSSIVQALSHTAGRGSRPLCSQLTSLCLQPQH